MTDPSLERRDVERLVYFSDAVTAIAMTLLAIDLPLPKGGTETELWHSVGSYWWVAYFPFLLSFVVIAAYWWSHHELFRRVVHLGPGLFPVNMLFLLMMVSLPYATRVIGMHGHHQVATVLYASVVSVSGLSLVVMSQLVMRRGWIRDPAVDEPELRASVRSTVVTSLAFLTSIPVTFLWSPRAAVYWWLVASVGVGVVLRLARRVIGVRRRHQPVAVDDADRAGRDTVAEQVGGQRVVGVPVPQQIDGDVTV